ncbi:hypothetical protein GYMLUDRAFT_32597 [Collybiopsis luxurians FD-317 M1]|nr:hypothetical protein GYMLUDRAFT_32597 [Collybiopsis luxurians FD-317 M1]
MSWILPQLDFRVEDLSHPGTQLFFAHIPNHNPHDVMKRAVDASWRWLYGWHEDIDSAPKAPLAVRRVKRITLTLRPMDGVAHTFGNDEGSEKEVHFSTKHIVNSFKGDTEHKKNIRVQEEIMGVLVHEIVHCYQYNAKGTAPGGLIEGIADCVRLHENLSPPHWKRVAPKGKHVPDPERPNESGRWVWDWNWDAGYERTAYFLDWIDTKLETSLNPLESFFPNLAATSNSAPPLATSMPSNPVLSANPSAPQGKGGFFRALNARLEDSEWTAESDLFLEITNWPRAALWDAYCAETK